MPIHDWTKVPAGLFHDFHQSWAINLKYALNAGVLPAGLSAYVEQHSGPKVPDVLGIELPEPPVRRKRPGGGGTATLERPKTRWQYQSDRQIDAGNANRIVVKHHKGRIVAIIEILSPGNKDSKAAIRDLLDKTFAFLRSGVHVLIVDLFPPTRRDPRGIHALIWDQIGSDYEFELPPDKNRVLASYEATIDHAAFVETIGVGDPLPSMPLFLPGGFHVKVPLEESYTFTWDRCTEEVQDDLLAESLHNHDED